MADIHVVEDFDGHFIINPITRKITQASPLKYTLVQYDDNSERFTFEIPRYVEGHDMSESDVVEVHYINQSKNRALYNADVYEVSDVHVTEKDGEEIVIFSWLVSENATQIEGSLSFAIRFLCDKEDESYAWHTEICSVVNISKGIMNGEIAVTKYSDVLELWRKRLFVDSIELKSALLEAIEKKGKEKLDDLDLSDVIVINDESKIKSITQMVLSSETHDEIELYTKDDIDNIVTPITIDLNNLGGLVGLDKYEDSEWVAPSSDGLYIATNDSKVDINSPIASGNLWKHIIIPAEQGDTFTVFAAGGETPRAWCFIDSSGNSLKKADGSVKCIGTEIEAPANTAYLIVNDKRESGWSGRVYKGISPASDTAKKYVKNEDLSDFKKEVYLNDVYENWKVGSLSFDKETVNDTRLRSGYMKFPVGTTLYTRTGYSMTLRFFDESYTYVGGTTDWTNEITTTSGIVRVVLRRDDQGKIGLSEKTNFYVTPEYPTRFDKMKDEFRLFVNYGDESFTDIESGSWLMGQKNANSKRLRSKSIIELDVNVPYEIKVAEGYLVNAQYLNPAKKYTGKYLDYSNKVTVVPSIDTPYFAVNIKKEVDGDISVSELASVHCTITKKQNVIDSNKNIQVSRWYGKKANFLGDSITYGYRAGTNFSWIERCKSFLGLATARNYGISNSTVSNHNDPMCVRYADMSDDADLIVILAGRNDYRAFPVPIGTKGSTDTSTFYGAMKVLLDGLWNKYPTKTIVFCTPYKALVATTPEQRDNVWENEAGHTQLDYVNAIKDICSDYAIPVIDLYNSGNFTSWNQGMKDAYFADTVHPNQDGDKFLGEVIGARLASL